MLLFYCEVIRKLFRGRNWTLGYPNCPIHPIWSILKNPMPVKRGSINALVFDLDHKPITLITLNHRTRELPVNEYHFSKDSIWVNLLVRYGEVIFPGLWFCCKIPFWVENVVWLGSSEARRFHWSNFRACRLQCARIRSSVVYTGAILCDIVNQIQQNEHQKSYESKRS